MNRRIIASFLSALILSTNVYPASFRGVNSGAESNISIENNQWKGKRVAFLGDSITDKKHVGTTKCYWEYLAEMLGLTPYVYGINGNQMNGILKQAQRLLEERGDSIDAIFIFAGTNDFNAGVRWESGTWRVRRKRR